MREPGNTGRAPLLLGLACLGLLGGPGALSTPESPPPAQEILDRVQATHGRLQDLQCRFIQTHRSRSRNREITETGTLSIRFPGRMRWDYREPEVKVGVLQGNEFLLYLPEDRAAYRFRDYQRPFLDFLRGKGRLSSAFRPEHTRLSAPLRPTHWQLRLTPLRELPGVERIYLEVDPARWLVVRVILDDTAGDQTDYRFADIQTDVGFRKDFFRLALPPGVAVQDGEALLPPPAE